MAKKKTTQPGEEKRRGNVAKAGSDAAASRTGRRVRSEAEQLWVIRQGQLLREVRQEWERKTGRNLGYLVDVAQVSRNVYYGYEGGRMCPSSVVLAKLAEAMGVPIEALFPDTKLLED